MPALTTVDAAPDPAEEAGGRVRCQPVRHEHGGTTTDVGGGLQRAGLSTGDWIELNGPFNLLNINAITFRTSGGTAGGNAGTVEIWRDAINAAGGGSLVTSVTIAGTANATTYASQTYPISDTGSHRYFLVFQPAAGGPGNNFFNLNWTEFIGTGSSRALGPLRRPRNRTDGARIRRRHPAGSGRSPSRALDPPARPAPETISTPTASRGLSKGVFTSSVRCNTPVTPETPPDRHHHPRA